MKAVIIGGSIAGSTVAFTLRKKLPQASVTIISDEAFPLYDRRKLLDYWSGRIKEKELFLLNADAYEKLNIALLKECKVVSVNPNRHTVSYKKDDTRQSIEYDFLIVASGSRTAKPDIEGISKTGVLRFDSLEDFKELKSCVTEDAVCLIGRNDYLDRITSVLTSRNIEVKLFAGQRQVVDETTSAPHEAAQTPQTDVPAERGPAVPAESKGAAADTAASVEEVKSEIVELIGESGVQAIKLKEGKIIGVSWVGLTLPPEPNIDFLKDTGIELTHGAIAVDDGMRTSLSQVFACGSVCLRRGESPRTKTWEEAQAEAYLVVEQLLPRTENDLRV